MKIGLVSCGKAKFPGTHAARDLYTSTLFKESLRWAEAHCDAVYVISDKHGLLPLDQQVEDYEVDMASFTKEERDEWGRRARVALRLKPPVEVFVLAGELYVDALKLKRTPGVTVHTPLEGKRQGQRVQWLQQQNAKTVAHGAGVVVFYICRFTASSTSAFMPRSSRGFTTVAISRNPDSNRG